MPAGLYGVFGDHTSGTPPLSYSLGNGVFILALEIMCINNPTYIVGVAFWKDVADTAPSHTATVYKSTDSSLQGTAPFVGETASGWQTVMLPATIPIIPPNTYKICVSSTVKNVNGAYGGSANGNVQGLSTGWYVAGTSGVPNGAAGGTWFGMDVIVSDTPLVTSRAYRESSSIT